MWTIIQDILPIFLVVLLITQYIIPIAIGHKTWWLFRPEDKNTPKLTASSALAEELSETKAVVEKVKAEAELVKNKIEENLKTAEDLKKDADKLFKNK